VRAFHAKGKTIGAICAAPTVLAAAGKLVAVPLLFVLGGIALGFRGMDLGILLLMSSAPSAAAGYVMVRAMGGNAVLAANIIALRQIQHSSFESATLDTPAPTLPPRGRTAIRPTSESDRHSRALTGRHPFTLEFTARKDAMLTVLNRLAVCDLFVTVKDIDVRKSGADVKAPPENWREMGIAHHQQRVVSGPELDSPLLVRMTLEVEIF